MILQNFKITSLGKAQLSIDQQGNLLLSKKRDSGLDGVMINVIGHDTHEFYLQEQENENFQQIHPWNKPDIDSVNITSLPCCNF